MPSSSSITPPHAASSVSAIAVSPLSRISETSQLSNEEHEGRERVEAFLRRRPQNDDFVSPKQTISDAEEATTASDSTPLRVRSQTKNTSTRNVRSIGSGQTWQAAAGIPTRRPDAPPVVRPPQPRVRIFMKVILSKFLVLI